MTLTTMVVGGERQRSAANEHKNNVAHEAKCNKVDCIDLL